MYTVTMRYQGKAMHGLDFLAKVVYAVWVTIVDCWMKLNDHLAAPAQGLGLLEYHAGFGTFNIRNQRKRSDSKVIEKLFQSDGLHQHKLVIAARLDMRSEIVVKIQTSSSTSAIVQSAIEDRDLLPWYVKGEILSHRIDQVRIRLHADQSFVSCLSLGKMQRDSTDTTPQLDDVQVTAQEPVHMPYLAVPQKLLSCSRRTSA